MNTLVLNRMRPWLLETATSFTEYYREKGHGCRKRTWGQKKDMGAEKGHGGRRRRFWRGGKDIDVCVCLTVLVVISVIMKHVPYTG